LDLAFLCLWEGFGGGFEEEVKEVAAFAEDAAQDCRRVPASPCGQPMAGYLAPLGFGDGEDELAAAGVWSGP
jgi:hypothetical protein